MLTDEQKHGGKSAPYPSTQAELIMAAWGLIANANEGDWAKATGDWRAAAVQWRDGFHAWLGEPDEWEYGALFQDDPSDAEPWPAGRNYEEIEPPWDFPASSAVADVSPTGGEQ